jgi:hypothetical protein
LELGNPENCHPRIKHEYANTIRVSNFRYVFNQTLSFASKKQEYTINCDCVRKVTNYSSDFSGTVNTSRLKLSRVKRQEKER